MSVDVFDQCSDAVWAQLLESVMDAIVLEQLVDVVEMPAVLEEAFRVDSRGRIVDGCDLLQQRALGRQDPDVEGREFLPRVSFSPSVRACSATRER